MFSQDYKKFQRPFINSSRQKTLGPIEPKFVFIAKLLAIYRDCLKKNVNTISTRAIKSIETQNLINTNSD